MLQLFDIYLFFVILYWQMAVLHMSRRQRYSWYAFQRSIIQYTGKNKYFTNKVLMLTIYLARNYTNFAYTLVKPSPAFHIWVHTCTYKFVPKTPVLFINRTRESTPVISPVCCLCLEYCNKSGLRQRMQFYPSKSNLSLLQNQKYFKDNWLS